MKETRKDVAEYLDTVGNKVLEPISDNEFRMILLQLGTWHSHESFNTTDTEYMKAFMA